MVINYNIHNNNPISNELKVQCASFFLVDVIIIIVLLL